MMQLIRDKSKGLLSLILVGLIALVFMLWGVGDYLSARPESIAATVNGQKISQSQLDREYERLAKQVQEIEDPKAYKTDLLQAIVEREAVYQAISKQKLLINDGQIMSWISVEPQFMDEDGKFSKEKFGQMLRANGYDQREFAQDMRRGLVMNQFQQGFILSGFALEHELADHVALNNQSRVVQYTTLSPAKLMSDINPTQEEVLAYYEQNSERYHTPDRVKFEYVELDYYDLVKQVDPVEADLKQYYDENQGLFTTPEQVQASHILFALSPVADQEKIDAVNESIAVVQKRLSEGESFADLAKVYSDDTASAKKGGELDWFGKGQMVAVFEDAAFALPKGEISEPVKSDFGYHLIHVTDKKPMSIDSYDSVHQNVKQLYKSHKADELMAVEGEKMAMLAFEHPESLVSIADELGLEIKESDWVTEHTTSADKVVGDKKVLAMVFDPTLQEQQLNSELIERNPQSYVVVRVIEHQPSALAPFADIESTVDKDLKQSLAASKAATIMDSLNSALDNKPVFDEILGRYEMTWKTSPALSGARPQTVEEVDLMPMAVVAFKMPRPQGDDVTAKPALVDTLPNGDKVLMQLVSITDGDLSTLEAADQKEMLKSLGQAYGNIDFEVFAETAVKQADIDIVVSN